MEKKAFLYKGKEELKQAILDAVTSILDEALTKDIEINISMGIHKPVSINYKVDKYIPGPTDWLDVTTIADNVKQYIGVK